jgi:hypothetical protein
LDPEAINAFLYSLYDLVRTQSGFAILEFDGSSDLSCEWPGTAGLAIDKLREIGQLGMIRAHPDSWVQAVVAHSHAVAAEDSSVHTLSHSEVAELIRAFCLLPGQRHDRNDPVLFIMPSNRTLVLDLVFAGDFLVQLLG